VNHLPILGYLFKNKITRRENNELLIFITPKIKQVSGPGATAASSFALGGAAH